MMLISQLQQQYVFFPYPVLQFLKCHGLYFLVVILWFAGLRLLFIVIKFTVIMYERDDGLTLLVDDSGLVVLPCESIALTIEE